MIQQNSLLSYSKIKTDGTLQKRQKQVYDCIAQNRIVTDKEIAAIILLPINQVTPRRGELVKLGLIEQRGNKIQPNNHQAKVWGIK